MVASKINQVLKIILTWTNKYRNKEDQGGLLITLLVFLKFHSHISMMTQEMKA